MVHVFLQSVWAKNKFGDTPGEEINYRTLKQYTGLSRKIIIHYHCDFLKGGYKFRTLYFPSCTK